MLRMGSMVEASTQRLNRLQGLMTTRAIPILSQLLPMPTCPLNDETMRPRRQLASNQSKALDVNRSLEFAVASMEMRPTEMVNLVVVHPNADSIEGADARHGCISSPASTFSPLRLSPSEATDRLGRCRCASAGMSPKAANAIRLLRGVSRAQTQSLSAERACDINSRRGTPASASARKALSEGHNLLEGRAVLEGERAKGYA